VHQKVEVIPIMFSLAHVDMCAELFFHATVKSTLLFEPQCFLKVLSTHRARWLLSGMAPGKFYNSRDTIPIRPTTNQVLFPQNTRGKNPACSISLLRDLTN